MRQNARRWGLAVVAALALVLGACVPGGPNSGTPPGPTSSLTASPTQEPTAPPEPSELPRSNVGVQLFQFSWDSVADQCTTVLGPAGYGWVLVTPPQEHIDMPEWWASYQPVSHKVESRQGTREQFAAMTLACHEAGVRVVVDAVINHMSGFEEGVGWAGTQFTQYEYPGLFTFEDFNHCGLTPDDDINDYQDAEQVQNCELVNLADLDTSSEYVRGTLRAYLADLITLGADGFRIDAAKHMPPEDIGAIITGLPASTWIIQEVIRSAAEPIQPEDYLVNGDVFEFAYMREIKGVLGGSSWNYFLQLGEGPGFVPSDQAVPFVANHDTERSGRSLTYRNGPAYQLATTLMILQGYGQPMVYSGYSFTDTDAGPLLAPDRTVAPAVCLPGWEAATDGEYVCTHTWPMVRAAVRFAAVGGDSTLGVAYQDRNVLALTRDGVFAAVNRSADEPITLSLPTGLPAGRYCDLVSECSRSFAISDDAATTLTLAPLGAVVFTVEDLDSSAP